MGSLKKSLSGCYGPVGRNTTLFVDGATSIARDIIHRGIGCQILTINAFNLIDYSRNFLSTYATAIIFAAEVS
ncbi:MAG: hypothetical protein HQM16_19365 [Deltaproteobacteria bacterium]|nr:hypothetical protein [Deltaproteobacteria bacterium]